MPDKQQLVCSNTTYLINTHVHFNQITDDCKFITDCIFESKPELKANIKPTTTCSENTFTIMRKLSIFDSESQLRESLGTSPRYRPSFFEWHLPSCLRELNHILEAIISEKWIQLLHLTLGGISEVQEVLIISPMLCRGIVDHQHLCYCRDRREKRCRQKKQTSVHLWRKEHSC